MPRTMGRPWWLRDPSASAALAVAAVGLLATGYQILCGRFLAPVPATGSLPPLPAVFLLGLVGAALINGAAVGATHAIRTHRFTRRLDARTRPAPPRLALAGGWLGLGDRLTCLDEPGLAACCYGFLRPRVAVTAALVARLDDEELVAVLAHERHHLRRRDPARYLAIRALAAAAFMLPAAAAVRRRLETRLELAADRAALAVASNGALAGALLTVLAGPDLSAVGAAGLSPTEARIAHLAGAPAVPPIPARAVAASLAVLLVVAAAAADLASSGHLFRMLCPLCVGW